MALELKFDDDGELIDDEFEKLAQSVLKDGPLPLETDDEVVFGAEFSEPVPTPDASSVLKSAAELDDDDLPQSASGAVQFKPPVIKMKDPPPPLGRKAPGPSLGLGIMKPTPPGSKFDEDTGEEPADKAEWEARWTDAARAALECAAKQAEASKRRALAAQEAEHQSQLQDAEQKSKAMVHAALVAADRKYKIMLQRTSELLEKQEKQAAVKMQQAVHSARREALSFEFAAGSSGTAKLIANQQWRVENYVSQIKQHVQLEEAVHLVKATCNGRVHTALQRVMWRAENERSNVATVEERLMLERERHASQLARVSKEVSAERRRTREVEEEHAATQRESREKLKQLLDLAEDRQNKLVAVVKQAKYEARKASLDKQDAVLIALEAAAKQQQEAQHESEMEHKKKVQDMELESEEKMKRMVHAALTSAERKYDAMLKRTKEQLEKEKKDAIDELLRKLSGQGLRALTGPQGPGSSAAGTALAVLGRRDIVTRDHRDDPFRDDMMDDLP